MANPLPSPTAERSSEPPWRYERKFAAPGMSLGEIQMRMRLQPVCFREAYPPRDVNSIYLDRDELRAFRLHLNGSPERDKLRIRWYGAPRGSVSTAQLEVKSKRGMVGSKQRFRLAPFAYGPDFAFRAWQRAALPRIDDPRVAELVNSSVPTLKNRYRRHYLTSADGRFRLTIDTDLRFERVLGAPALGPVERFEERDFAILELKYAPEHDAEAAKISNRLPFRVLRLSKYLAGVARLRGYPL